MSDRISGRSRLTYGNVELVVDPDRIDRDNTTGIYVRAIFDGAWGSYDVACLNLVSLFAWLHSRGQQNVLAENTLAIVLGHANFDHEVPVVMRRKP